MDARIEVEGLKESLRALRLFDDATRKEVPRILREGAGVVKKAAQAKLAGRPGGGTYPRRIGSIRSGASAAKAEAWVGYKGSVVSRYPWALGAEFGANRAWVYGRTTLQSKLSRRQFPTRNPEGWIVGKAVPEKIPEVESQLVTELAGVLTAALNRAGVPKGGV